MRKIEKLISPFVESQFPSFYLEEGPQFVSFIKAYYEWLESNQNPLWYSRRLPDLRDIDTTLDEFLLYFKEKYLKNIQFDISTNKKLLIKNSLQLYRSKGTERSIDLFFKLVYGTSAEVKYPSENIFRLSDGVWEVPLYLEVTYSRYNVDYVGKKIIGSNSNATAFVEKYIRRRAGYGYVNMLYVSNVSGRFRNGDLIGVLINGQPKFNESKNAKLLGSVSRVEIVNRSRDFEIGDVVSFQESPRGKGGLARVSSVSSASGLVDFILIEGGYGYTLNAESIVSEKVLTLNDIEASNNSVNFFYAFEKIAEPLVTINYETLTGSLALGDQIYRYSANTVVGTGKIIRTTTTETGGEIIVSPISGTFAHLSDLATPTSNITYYNSTNTSYFTSTAVIDETITAEVMGLPTEYFLAVSNTTGLEIGEKIYQSDGSVVVGSGNIRLVSNNTISLENVRGSFRKNIGISSQSDPTYVANVSSVYASVGVYNIQKEVRYVNYTGANNNSILNATKIYQYAGNVANVTAEALVLTSAFSSTANSGNLTIIPLKGDFEEAVKFYTQGNTAYATITTWGINTDGGDFNISSNAQVFTLFGNTYAVPTSASSGTGASFEVGTIGETEVIFINTDLLRANNEGYLDYFRKVITVASNTGFSLGDYVYQNINKIAFNPSTSLSPTTGFITIPTASSRFSPGDVVQYTIAAGNTAINGLSDGGYYVVYQSNSTGIIISYNYDNERPLTNAYYSTFANNLISETGHYINKIAYGTVFELGSGLLRVKDISGEFGTTAAGGNTTVYANSNIILYSNTSVNTSVTTTAAYTTIQIPEKAYRRLYARSAAYGFPKNPQGGFNDTIFSCLSFGRFEIGIISSLTGINPGSDYSADPYVLAYEPAIAGFNRKDYVIKLNGSTRDFVVGEKIEQVPSTLVVYNLKVGEGVFGNTYNEVVKEINGYLDIDSANDFIYITGTATTINASDDIDSASDFISISGNPYAANTLVRYEVNSSNTTISGLSNNTLYYVKFSNSSGITLSTTAGGANINLTGSNVVSFNSATGVNSSGDYITISSAASLALNDQVRYYTGADTTPLTGLTNNEVYYIVWKSGANIALSTTLGGANLDISSFATGSSNNFFRYYNPNYNGHTIKNFVNPYVNNQKVNYRTLLGETAITGLTDNTVYYVVQSNTSGIKLSATLGGAQTNITAKGATSLGHYFSTIPGYLPKDQVYQTVTKTFNANTAVNSTADAIILSPQPFKDGDYIQYYTSTGNTVISGLSNASYYYVYGSNSTAVQLKNTLGDASPINLTASVTSESGHTLKSIATGTISSVALLDGNNFVKVINVFNTFTTGFNLQSNTNLYVNSSVSNVELTSTTFTAKGIVKAGSNTSTLYVKRITFEDTFQVGVSLTGEVSDATGIIAAVEEQEELLYPIGLNAVIEANVSSANGQVSSLQVIDSGIGYANSETVSFVSSDGSREGTVRVILDGLGQGSGFYKTSKGFLSEDMYIHDGDYYQEYSYEIFSKLSVDRYSDMFKKVMHTAGTKFFGSVSVTEEASANIEFQELATSQEVSFNAQLDVTSNEIFLDVEKDFRAFNPSADVNNSIDFITIDFNPFTDGDLLKYYTASGNTVLSGLSNNAFYYVVESNTSGIKLSTVSGGSVLPVNSSGAVSETGHYFQSYSNPFSNGDIVAYSFDAGNTALTISISETFNINSAITNNFIVISNNEISSGHEVSYTPVDYQNVLPGLAFGFNSNTGVSSLRGGSILFSNNKFTKGDYVKYYTSTGNTALTGLSNNTNYYVSFSNTTSIKLSTANTHQTLKLTNTNVFSNSYYNPSLTNADGLEFSSDGSKMYVSDSSPDTVNQYKLRIPWQVNTATYETSFNASAYDAAVMSIRMRSDGEYLYITSVSSSKVTQFKLDEPYNVSTATYSSNLNVSAALGTNQRGLEFNEDGTAMYIANSSGYFSKYTLSTPWQVSTAVLDNTVNLSIASTSVGDFRFVSNGYVMVRSQTSSTVSRLRVYNLSTPWNLTTAVLDSNFADIFSTSNGNISGIAIKPDYGKIYVNDKGTNYVREYNQSFVIPSTTIESGHNLIKLKFYSTGANTSGMYLSMHTDGEILNVSPSNVSSVHTLSVSALSNNVPYYVVNTTPNSLKLTTFSGAAAINITTSPTSEVGHYLTKTVEESD